IPPLHASGWARRVHEELIRRIPAPKGSRGRWSSRKRTTAPAVSAGAVSCAETQRSLRPELLLDHGARALGIRRRHTKGDTTPDMPQRDLGREGAGAGPGEGRLAKESAPSVEDVERDRRRLGHGEVEREQASACEVRSPHDGGEVVDRDGRWRVPDHEGRGRRGGGGGRARGRRRGSSRRRAARRRAGARGRRTRGGRRGGRRPGGRRRRGRGRRGRRRAGGGRRGGGGGGGGGAGGGGRGAGGGRAGGGGRGGGGA